MSTTSTDPIADMLTRIRNAINVQKNEVKLPHSKAKEAIAQVLKSSGFISDLHVSDLSVGKQLEIVIYPASENARITEIKRLSKPGRREYSPASKIPSVRHGRGIVIVSTSKGVMTGAEAKAAKIGGELIASVY